MKILEVAVKGIIRKGGTILLLKRSTLEKVAPGEWDTPGGKLQFGETVEQAFKRELFEEVGMINITINKVLNVWSLMKDSNTQVIGVTFLCNYRDGNIHLSSEHAQFKWVDPKLFIDTLTTETGLKQTLHCYLLEYQ